MDNAILVDAAYLAHIIAGAEYVKIAVGCIGCGVDVFRNLFGQPEQFYKFLEKDYNLKIATELKNILEVMGANVVMSRDSDEFVSLDKRIETAKENCKK